MEMCIWGTWNHLTHVSQTFAWDNVIEEEWMTQPRFILERKHRRTCSRLLNTGLIESIVEEGTARVRCVILLVR